MSHVPDYYSILGIPASASDDDIRQAFRLAAQHFHPDVNAAPGATLIFQDINTAYEVLSDRVKRAAYDEQLRGQAASGGMGLHAEISYSRQMLRRMDEPQLLYVLLKLQPLHQTDMSSSAPLNLALVIDRSTSMKGDRLQQVKWAAHRIIDSMSPDDLISVISFSDNAEVLIPAQRKRDPRSMKALVSTLQASGATAILSGLRLGMQQIERNLDPRYVNHVILITDGRTYGDEAQCLNLAASARERGVGISGMGIGEDWNDSFLDEITSITGGTSAYIASPETVTTFLESRIRSLATAYAERAAANIVPVPGVSLKTITRTAPDAMTLPVDSQPVALGTLDSLTPTNLMLQLHVHAGAAPPGPFFLGRIAITADILGSRQETERLTYDLYVEVGEQEVEQEPPPDILDALSRLMLYRLQDRAREAISVGNVVEATRKLETLATRLFESGQESLAQAALQEARHISATRAFSEVGAKQLKYGTRMLTDSFPGDVR